MQSVKIYHIECKFLVCLFFFLFGFFKKDNIFLATGYRLGAYREYLYVSSRSSERKPCAARCLRGAYAVSRCALAASSLFLHTMGWRVVFRVFVCITPLRGGHCAPCAPSPPRSRVPQGQAGEGDSSTSSLPTLLPSQPSTTPLLTANGTVRGHNTNR